MEGIYSTKYYKSKNNAILGALKVLWFHINWSAGWRVSI